MYGTTAVILDFVRYANAPQPLPGHYQAITKDDPPCRTEPKCIHSATPLLQPHY